MPKVEGTSSGQEEENSVTEDDDVTDEDLNSAPDDSDNEGEGEEEYEEFFGEGEEESENGESFEDHQENSKIGRKVKKQGVQLDSLSSDMKEIRDLLRARGSANEFSEDLPDIITTAEDVNAVLDQRERVASASASKYENAYINELESIAVSDDNLHQAIEKEMMSNFNVKHSKNGALDARINYAEAKAAIISKQLSTRSRKVPGRKERTNSSTRSGTSKGTSRVKAKAPVRLDAFAADFVRKTGMNENSVRHALEDQE